MNNEDQKYAAFIKFEMGEEPHHIRKFKMASSLDTVKLESPLDKSDSPFSSGSVKDGAEIAEIVSEDLSESEELFAELISKFYDNISPYHQLVDITSNLRGLSAQVAVTEGIYQKVKDGGTLISEEDGILIYGLNKICYAEISLNLSQMREMDIGLSLLPSSVLLSLVATFDSLIADCTKKILCIYPEKISSSERVITYRQLFTLNDIDQVRINLINEEISNMLRGSHSEQVEYLEKLSDTKITAHYSRWSNFLEIFERRNCVAHNNGLVNDTYVDKSKRYNFQIEGKKNGDKFDLRPKYLHKCIDILIEFGTLFIFVAWQKMDSSSSASAFSRMNEVCYELIQRRRFTLAEWLLDFALHRQKRSGDEITIRMMIVNLAITHKKRGDDTKCEEILSGLDWSASSDMFKLALASLREDVAHASSLLIRLAKAEEIESRSVRDWPVFDWIRGEPLFSDAFEEAFGEPLGVKVVSTESGESTVGMEEIAEENGSSNEENIREVGNNK